MTLNGTQDLSTNIGLKGLQIFNGLRRQYDFVTHSGQILARIVGVDKREFVLQCASCLQAETLLRQFLSTRSLKFRPYRIECDF